MGIEMCSFLCTSTGMGTRVPTINFGVYAARGGYWYCKTLGIQ